MSSKHGYKKYGYEIYEKTINHLFYMDAEMVYATNDKKHERPLSTAKHFSDDVGMEFGQHKCPKETFIKGKLTRTAAAELDISTNLRIPRNWQRKWNTTRQDERKDKERVL